MNQSIIDFDNYEDTHQLYIPLLLKKGIWIDDKTVNECYK